MIATKFVICLLASVVVTMGFKLDKGDEGFPRREADEAQKGHPRREADETLEMSAYNAGDGGFKPTNEGFSRREALEASEALEANVDLPMNAGPADGFPSREADSDVPEEEDSVETKDIRTNNSTLSRQAAYPTGCGLGRDDPSHLAIRLVKEAFDTYSSLRTRRDIIWMKFEDAKKIPRVVTVNDNLPWDRYSHGSECVYYAGWYSTIYY